MAHDQPTASAVSAPSTTAPTDAGPEVHEHPTWSTYWKVALILTVITVVEVWAYYVPAFVASKLFVPSLLIMSAAKFTIVVLFYMHLRYDSRLFRVLFGGPLVVAMVTIFALLFLFGQLAVRLGL